MSEDDKAARYAANWQDERNSAALYRAISEVEPNPQLKTVYGRLGEAEERHSRFWADKLRSLGRPLPPVRLNWRTQRAHLSGPSLRPGVRPPELGASLGG